MEGDCSWTHFGLNGKSFDKMTSPGVATLSQVTDSCSA